MMERRERSGGPLALICIGVFLGVNLLSFLNIATLLLFEDAIGGFSLTVLIIFGGGLEFVLLLLALRKLAVWTTCAREGGGVPVLPGTADPGRKYTTAAVLLVIISLIVYIGLHLLLSRPEIYRSIGWNLGGILEIGSILAYPFICLFAYYLYRYRKGIPEKNVIHVETQYPESRAGAVLILASCCAGVAVLFGVIAIAACAIAFGTRSDLLFEMLILIGSPVLLILLLIFIPMLAEKTVVLSERKAASPNAVRYIVTALLIPVFGAFWFYFVRFVSYYSSDNLFYSILAIPFLIAYGVMLVKNGKDVVKSRGAVPGVAAPLAPQPQPTYEPQPQAPLTPQPQMPDPFAPQPQTPVAPAPIGAVPQHQTPVAPAPQPQAAPAADDGDIPVSSLKSLKELRDLGIITEEEYKAKAMELLD